jgi:CDP-6-deoxy-D-xylo-4-hexulose-3-dehydrase
MKKIGIAEPSYDSEEIDAVLKVLQTGRLKQGPLVQELEERFSQYVGMENGVAVNSGSSANLVVFEVLKEVGKLKAKDEVITSALTWPTTVYPIVQVGCKPIFVDSDPMHFCISPEKVEDAVTERTKALIIIHYCGHPCKMDEIMDIVQNKDIILIEDCCQSHGATYKGKQTGSFGDFSTFSFATTHGMTCGEGGMVLMKNERYDRVARSIREFGRSCSCKICKVSVEGVDRCNYGKPSELRFSWSRLGYSF